MMFTAVGVSFVFYLVAYLGAIFIRFLITLCLLLTGSLLTSGHCLAHPQLASRAVTCKAELPQVWETFTIHGVLKFPFTQGEATVSWPHGYHESNPKPCQEKPTHVLTRCTQFNTSGLLPFRPSCLPFPPPFFYLKYNLHLSSVAASRHVHQLIQDPLMLCYSTSRFVNRDIWRSLAGKLFLCQGNKSHIFEVKTQSFIRSLFLPSNGQMW